MMHSLLLVEALSVQNWIYILVGVTFALYIGITIWSRVGSTREFYVSGGGVSPLANGMALLLIVILYTTAPAVSVFARANLIETVSNIPYALLPEWFKKKETTGLIVFDDKNKDGLIQYVANKDQNELTVDNDIMVLANPEIAKLPNWVIALVGVGGLAAALSTAAGLFLVISSSVSHDLIKKIINPKISEKGKLVAARLPAVGAVCVAEILALICPYFWQRHRFSHHHFRYFL